MTQNKMLNKLNRIENTKESTQGKFCTTTTRQAKLRTKMFRHQKAYFENLAVFFLKAQMIYEI